MDVTMRNNLAAVTFESASEGAEKAIEWKEGDHKMILVLSATTATTLTVKAGNGIQGSADLTLTVPEGTSLVKLESGRFKNVTGNNKGKIVVVPAAALNIGVVALV